MEKGIIGDWFSAYPLMEGIWRISDHGRDNMYLVVGRDRAMVIDTGFGAENLADFVRKITPLPTVTVITHGHLDHALGNGAFDEVYAAQADLVRFSDENAAEMSEFVRRGEAGGRAKPNYAGAGAHARKRDLILTDGRAFDLGGRTVTAFLTPGHTAGSVCLLDDRSRALFTGDSYVTPEIWGPVWMHIRGSTPLSVFHASMRRLWEAGGFDTLLSGHGETGPVPASNLLALVDGVKGILDGTQRGEPEHTFAGDGLRCCWPGAGVIYNPDNL